MKLTQRIVLAGFILASIAAPAAWAREADDILKATGVRGGLVVHVGCGGGELTAALRANDSMIVQGLDTSAVCVAATRSHAARQGLAGKVSAAVYDGRHLPYADNIVNLLVVTKADIARDEILRVLAPGGVAYVVTNTAAANKPIIVKPRPKNIDEWTHYLHGPGNNAVANDSAVGPPRHMQWLAGPRWTRTHHGLNTVSSVVTAGGRLFYIVDSATAANKSVPGKWSVVARGAFNGVKLWTKKIDSWAVNPRFRSGPPQVTRLLVTGAGRVYAPLGLGEAITVMDAATGKTLAELTPSKAVFPVDLGSVSARLFQVMPK